MYIRRRHFAVLMGVLLTVVSCKEDATETPPLSSQHMAAVNRLMADLADSPQRFSIPSGKKTALRGLKGTVIHIDPDVLETADGSAIGKQIDVQLIEMTDKASLIKQNATTVSDGRLLVSGGAYYLDMSSGGKALQMKEGKSTQVEFPRISREPMQLFAGERDSMGQINWKATGGRLADQQVRAGYNKGRADTSYVRRSYDGLEAIMDYVDGDSGAKAEIKEEKVSKEDYRNYLRRKAERQTAEKAYETTEKTYESIGILKFGWINCDYFFSDKAETTNITLAVADDSIKAANFYGVFIDIRSVMESTYWNGNKTELSGVPSGQKIHVVGLAAKGTQPYIFEQTIISGKDKNINAHFTPATIEEIRKKLAALN